jgi:hypothetical protein
MRALLIDSEAASVSEIDLPSHKVDDGVRQLEALRRLVGGWIEFAYRFSDTNDVVFVDEEGKLKDPKHFFWIAGTPTPFAGNGVVCGGEDRQGNITPARSSIDAVRAVVQFSVGVTL